jgi:TPR repeat protein
MQDAEELFYESVQLGIRAKKALTPAQRDALYAKEYRMTKRVLRVDPTSISAQYNLGLMYHQGEGVQRDYKQAAAWYRKAAEQGDTQAQYNLGEMYEQGHGVQRDYKQAVAWHWKAADQGIADAQNKLGSMYHHGQGVQQDFKQAALWFQKAADQGLVEAQYNLGLVYHHGQGSAAGLQASSSMVSEGSRSRACRCTGQPW